MIIVNREYCTGARQCRRYAGDSEKVECGMSLITLGGCQESEGFLDVYLPAACCVFPCLII